MESLQYLDQQQEAKHIIETLSIERQQTQTNSSVTFDQNMCTVHDHLLHPRPSIGQPDNTMSTYESDDSSIARQDTESSSGAGYQADDSSVSSSQLYFPPLKIGKRRANPQHVSNISCHYQHHEPQEPSQDDQMISPSHGRRRRVKIQTKPTSVATFYETVNGLPNNVNQQQQQQQNLRSFNSHLADCTDKPDNIMTENQNYSFVDHNNRAPHSKQHVRHIHIDKENNKKQLGANEESAESGGSGTATHEASDIYSSSSIGIDVYVNLLQACRPFFTEMYGSATDKIFSSFQSEHHSTTPADPPTQNVCSVTQMNHEREESHRHIQLHKQHHLQPNSRESSSDGESPWGGSSSSMGEGRVDPKLLEQEQQPTNLGEEPAGLLNTNSQDSNTGLTANSSMRVTNQSKIAADSTGYHGHALALSRNAPKVIRANQDSVAANRELVRKEGAMLRSRAALVEDSSKSKGSSFNRADSTSNSNGAGLSHIVAAKGDRALVGKDTSSALNKTIDDLNKERFAINGATTIVTKTATEFSSSCPTSLGGHPYERSDRKLASYSSFPHAACLRHTTSNISSLSSSQKDSDENLTLPDNETLRTELAVRPNKRSRSKSTSDSGNSNLNVAKHSGIGASSATCTTSKEDASSEERPPKNIGSTSNVCTTNPVRTTNANAILHPKHLLTLEDVMTVSNVPRLVTKSSVPFTVVYANAAYTRLSGYDTHYAVGKPLPSLLKILPSLPPPPPCEVTVLISKSEEEISAKALELLLRPRDGVSSPFHVAYLVCSGEEGNNYKHPEPQLSSSDLGSLLKCHILIAPIVRNLNRTKRIRPDTFQPSSDTPFVVSATSTSSTHPAVVAANATNICAYYLIQIIQEEDANMDEYLKEFRQVTWNKTVG